jgi:hypothetical protein
MGGWVGPKATLEDLEKRSPSFLYRYRTLFLSVRCPVTFTPWNRVLDEELVLP